MIAYMPLFYCFIYVPIVLTLEVLLKLCHLYFNLGFVLQKRNSSDPDQMLHNVVFIRIYTVYEHLPINNRIS